jgi:uncharacterized protein (TIGR00369 family)
VTVLADAAMAAATSTMLTDEEVAREAVTTVDLFSRFLKAVKADAKTLRAEARVVRSGRQLIWAECDVTADGKEVGKFSATGVRVAFDASEAVMEAGAND